MRKAQGMPVRDKRLRRRTDPLLSSPFQGEGRDGTASFKFQACVQRTGVHK